MPFLPWGAHLLDARDLTTCRGGEFARTNGTFPSRTEWNGGSRPGTDLLRPVEGGGWEGLQAALRQVSSSEVLEGPQRSHEALDVTL